MSFSIGSFCGVLVIVFSSNARGPQFESWLELSRFFFKLKKQEVSKFRVTILPILSPLEEHIVNIVTPRGTYTEILSDLHTNERLSNVSLFLVCSR